MSYKLEYPYTEENNFIVEYNHNQDLRIEEVDNIAEVKTETEDGEVTLGEFKGFAPVKASGV